VSVDGTAVRVRLPGTITPIKAMAGDDCSASGTCLVASNGSRAIAISGHQGRTSAEIMREFFHSRPEEEQQPSPSGFDKALFIQDTSGSMQRQDNEGVYEILLDAGISCGFYSSERFLHWYSLDGTIGTGQVPPAEPFTILDYETRLEIPASEWFDEKARSYVIGASIDESDTYFAGGGLVLSQILEADTLFRGIDVEVKPLLFNEVERSTEGIFDLRAMLAAAPNISRAALALDYRRSDPVQGKAAAFLDLYEQAGLTLLR